MNHWGHLTGCKSPVGWCLVAGLYYPLYTGDSNNPIGKSQQPGFNGMIVVVFFRSFHMFPQRKTHRVCSRFNRLHHTHHFHRGRTCTTSQSPRSLQGQRANFNMPRLNTRGGAVQRKCRCVRRALAPAKKIHSLVFIFGNVMLLLNKLNMELGIIFGQFCLSTSQSSSRMVASENQLVPWSVENWNHCLSVSPVTFH